VLRLARLFVSADIEITLNDPTHCTAYPDDVCPRRFKRLLAGHRDLLLSGVVGVQFPIAAGASICVETGPTVVAEDTVRRTAPENVGPSGIPTGTFGPFGPETTVTRQTIGVLVGADTNVRVARHLDFVAQFHLYWVSRDDKLSTTAVLGLGPWIVQPALGLRFTFWSG
jgi:hypothetical protein